MHFFHKWRSGGDLVAIDLVRFFCWAERFHLELKGAISFFACGFGSAPGNEKGNAEEGVFLT